MPFCSNCGKEVLPGARFCPECGAPRTPASGQPAAQVAPARKRPTSASLFTLAYLGLGVVYLVLGSLLTFFASSVFAFGVALLMVFTGIVSLYSSYGLMKGRGWAAAAGKVTAVFFVALGIILILSLSTLFLVVGTLALVFGMGTFLFVRRSDTKAYLAS